MPKISFIMPAYKSAFLRQAIDSILAQTSENWELVVVDDCSPDDIGSIVASYNDVRIQYLRNDVNLGGKNLVSQWNHSIKFARGEWVVLAADDDEYAPEFAARIIALSEAHPEVDLIRSRVEQIDENGGHLWDDGTLPELTDKDEYFVSWMDARVFDCIGNFAFKRSSLEQIGGFIDFPCAFGSDIATPVAMSKNGVANTSEMLFKFRQSSNHLSGDASKFDEKLAAISQMYSWFSEQDFLKKYAGRLHGKCVYDYFNLVVKNVSLRQLPGKLSGCVLASPWEKIMMVLRWVKRRLI
ncbi:MAG: glycosyltransferase [Bacteroidales bacterium]|nr:glycosyltransferase [Bacteroidales bacterium]